MDYKERYNLWLNSVKDAELKNELQNMDDETQNLVFFKDIEFGTAGMRGTIGAGSNCMNIYNVAKVTKAICEHLKQKENSSVAVSYDSRNMSKEFAELVARICAFNGVKVYLADKMMPTPFLSYMVRYYQADMGVMITASHNPKEYNGYKVYGSDGCQLLDEPSLELSKLGNLVDPFSVEEMDLESAKTAGLLVFSDDEILESFLQEVKKQSIENVEDVLVVYSALNGTGINVIPEILKGVGAKVVLNDVQCVADKNFTTCPSPNPANTEVYGSSIEIAKKYGADLIIASDPDADRVGVNVLHEGEYVYLTGNEIGVLLADFVLSHKKVENGVIVKSIVTTNLVQKLAEKYGMKVHNVLTGFKYIGKFIKDLEEKREQDKFLLGFEESSGYLVGTYVRDKDASVASMLIAELASSLKKQGKTIVDRLNEIYSEFGLYEHNVYSYKFDGEIGFNKMQNIMSGLRKENLEEIGGLKVTKIDDYLQGIGNLPKANVIAFDLENDNQVIVRPSGTEPLVKFYVTLSQTKPLNEKNLKNIKMWIESVVK